MLALALVACLFLGVAAAVVMDRGREDADLRRRWQHRPSRPRPNLSRVDTAAILTYASSAQPPAPTTCPRCAAFDVEAYGNASSTSLWWRCGACGHVWATISRRS